MNKLYPAVLAAAMLTACSEPESVAIMESDTASAFESDDERILYALGVAVGESVSLAEFDLTPEEYELFSAGMRDAAADAPYQVDMELYGPQIQAFANERLMAGAAEAAGAEKEASAAFADEIAAEPGATRTESGLVYLPLEVGEGESPTAEDTVTVHYTGTLRDGTVFDSSVERGEPMTFPLQNVIPCWTEGVQMMQVGGTARLLCPSDIAYGDQGRPPTIPGGAALLFEVELLGIE